MRTRLTLQRGSIVSVASPLTSLLPALQSSAPSASCRTLHIKSMGSGTFTDDLAKRAMMAASTGAFACLAFAPVLAAITIRFPS